MTYAPQFRGRTLVPIRDNGEPICERCGTVVTDDMTAEFAPYCSAECQTAATGILPPPPGKRYPITSAESQRYIEDGDWPGEFDPPCDDLPSMADLIALPPVAKGILNVLRQARGASPIPIEDTVYAGMCFGAEGVKGEPICDGPDVRLVRAQAPAVPYEQGDGWFSTEWCADCRAQAEAQGYTVLVVPILDQPAGAE